MVDLQPFKPLEDAGIECTGYFIFKGTAINENTTQVLVVGPAKSKDFQTFEVYEYLFFKITKFY